MNYKKRIKNIHQQGWFCSRVLLLVLGCLFLSHEKAQATHYVGTGFTYTCLGNNQYKINLVLHRNCDGVGMSLGETINISSASCGITLPAITLTRDTFYEINIPQYCSWGGGATACNGGTLPGYELHSYCGIVTLPQTCTDWLISWSSCCRNSNIVTLVNPGSIYLEAMIDNTTCNSSPQFSVEPIVFFESGQCHNYNFGAVDPEQDTLKYALTCLLQGQNNCVSYIAGHGATQPMITTPSGPFTLDENTGQINFCTPANQAQIAAVAMTVYNVVNGDTIGYIQREVYLYILNGASGNFANTATAPAVVSGGTWNATSQTFEVCSGQTLIFETIAQDPDGDSLMLDANHTNFDKVFGAGNWNVVLLNTSPYRVDSLKVVVQINTTGDHVGVSQALLSLTDNRCPVAGAQIIGYQLNVLGVNGFVDNIETTLAADCSDEKAKTIEYYCAGEIETIPLNAIVSGSGTGSYAWSQLTGPTVSFSNTTIADPILTTPATTAPGDSIVIEVVYTDSNCTTSDQVVIYFDTLAVNLGKPTISCGIAAVPTSSILFEWGQVPGATAWEYSLDSGATWTNALLQDSSLLLTGLLQGTCYEIQVRAVGAVCGGVAMVDTFSCCTNVLSPAITLNGITLTALASGASIAYQWINCDNGNAPIIGATAQSFTPSANGNYAVIVEDGVNAVTSICTNVTISGVDRLKEAFGMLCYPNPTTGLLQIERSTTNEVAIEVSDNVGRILFTTSIASTKATIDLSEYPTGVYFITINDHKKQVVQKVIKR